jgi:hypothetical protein
MTTEIITLDNTFVMFQGRKVPVEYKEAHMNGYNNPHGDNKGGIYTTAYEQGQDGRKREMCMEGTF